MRILTGNRETKKFTFKILASLKQRNQSPLANFKVSLFYLEI